jgi:hypothetical protein
MGACQSIPASSSASAAQSNVVRNDEINNSRQRGSERRRTKKTRSYVKALITEEQRAKEHVLYPGVCSVPGGSKYDAFVGVEVDLSQYSRDYQIWLKGVKFHAEPKRADRSRTISMIDEMIEIAEKRQEENLRNLPSDDPEQIYRSLKTFQQTIPERINGADDDNEDDADEKEEEEEEVEVVNEDGTMSLIKQKKKKQRKNLFAKRPTPPTIPRIMQEAVRKALQDPDCESWTSQSPEMEKAFAEDFEYFTMDGATIFGRALAFSRMDKAIVDLRNRMEGSTRSNRKMGDHAMSVEGPSFVGRGETRNITKWEVLYKFDMLLMKVKICEIFDINEETGLVVKLQRFRI